MAKLFIKLALLLCLVYVVFGQEEYKKIVCYYNVVRENLGELPTNYLYNALDLCTHLVYGYADLTPDSYIISTQHMGRSLSELNELQSRYPHIKFYLSLGGDKDQEAEGDIAFIELLEGDESLYQNFIQSSIQLLKSFGFDGLDLAFRFPRNEPRIVELDSNFKLKNAYFPGEIMDEKADTHKQQFTDFVKALHEAFAKENLDLTLTVLPHVNSSSYFDIAEIQNEFEYINLFAFDFLTPKRNPNEADLTAPIHLPPGNERPLHYSVDFQVKYWIENGCPAHKLHLGIPTYARLWKLSERYVGSSIPVIYGTKGPAAEGAMSKKEGLLSYSEACNLQFHFDCFSRFTVKYGNPRHNFNKDRNWIDFSDGHFASIKCSYAFEMGLGGMAVVDISYDDFLGKCGMGKYPILRSVFKTMMSLRFLKLIKFTSDGLIS